MRKIEGNITPEILDFIGGDPKLVGSKPGFPIQTFSQLVTETAKLSYLNKDYLIFYRGQSIDYRNKGESSTFYPSIYRGDYLRQREIKNRFDILDGACKALTEIFMEHKLEGFKELQRKKLIQWSILQHYEVCGTPLLDFTQSLRVACSFALNGNTNNIAYIFVFGLPYITNRISINSEHDLVNIRLLSICPPSAYRPYFQEGYLAGTDDITTNYEPKSELDFNNRLIAKFEIQNNENFWGENFHRIPNDSLYPQNDPMWHICREVKIIADKELKSGDLGEFLKTWSELEEILINRTKSQSNRFLSAREAIRILFERGEITQELMYNIDRIRKFRNNVVHTPNKINPGAIKDYHDLLERLLNELKTSTNI